MTTVNTIIELPTMLSYKRSISQGRALMFACSDIQGNNPQALIVEEVGVRATKAFDIHKKIAQAKNGNGALAKTLEEVTTPNPQRIEAAFMPESKPFLKASFSLKYLPNTAKPYMVNNREIEGIFKRVVRGYSALGGFDELGQRYAIPLVTGLWMWRNNDEAINKVIRITVQIAGKKETLEFTPGYNAFTFDALNADDQVKATRLGQMIAGALSGTTMPLSVEVEAVYEMGAGMLAYPSQEMDMNSKEKGDLAKILYKVDNGGIKNQAALHEQKVGNALRTIDDWHGDENFDVQAVEPLGVVSTHQCSTRVHNKRDFYSLSKNLLTTWEKELHSGKPLDQVTQLNDLHFVIAVLVRGGAFV